MVAYPVPRQQPASLAQLTGYIMAKQAQRKPRISVVKDIVEYEDGGIYWREKKVGETRSSIPHSEFVKEMQRMGDHAGNLSAELNRVTVEAADVVRPHAQQFKRRPDLVPIGREVFWLDLGDGRKCYSLPALDTLPDNEREKMRDAIEVLRLIRELRAIVKNGGDCDTLTEAYRLGRIAERLSIRAFEHPAEVGRVMIGGTTRMRTKKRKIDNQNRDERKREAVATYNETAQELALDAARGNTKPIKSRTARKLGISTRQLTRRLGGK